MAKRLISLAGKVVRKSVADLDADRYLYLSLDQAEPNPGNPDSDNSLFFSNADGTRGFTKNPKLSGLGFDNGKLNEAGPEDDYALILNTNPTIAGDDSVGYRKLGDLAFTNEADITLQVVTENGNETTEGIVITNGPLTGNNSNNYGLQINGYNNGSPDNALYIADNTYSLIDGDLEITGVFNINTSNGEVRGTGITGLNSIELLVIDSATAPIPYRIGKRAFNFTAFDPPTLREVTQFTIGSGDQSSSFAQGASTPDGINAKFLKAFEIQDRTSAAGTYRTDYRRALVVDTVGVGLNQQTADSIGYRNLSDLALYDSTNDDIKMPRLFVREPGLGVIGNITGTVPLVFQDSVTKEYKVLDIDVTNLDNTFETLHSVAGRANVDPSLDVGETLNPVIFSGQVKLRNNSPGDPLNELTTNTVVVADRATSNDSAVVGIRNATDIAFDDSLVTLDFVASRGDSTNIGIKVGSAKVKDLVLNSVVYVGADGQLSDNPNLTFSTATNPPTFTSSGFTQLDSTTINGRLVVDGDDVYLNGALFHGEISNSEANFGMGTSTPTFFSGRGLEIERTTPVSLRLDNTGDNTVLEITTESGTVNFRGISAKPMSFFTSNLERLRIDADGDLNVLNNLDVDGLTTLDSTSIDAGAAGNGIEFSNVKSNENNSTTFLGLNGTTVETITIAQEAQQVDTLTTVTDPTRPAGFDTTPTPLYLNGGISTTAPPAGTATTYNVLVLQTPSGDSVEYLPVDADILDGTQLGLDEVLTNDPVSGRNIILTGTGGLTADSATLTFLTVSDSATVQDLVVLGSLRVDGATTIINSTELTVNDKNIVLADSAQQPSDANGGGITLKTGVDSSVNLFYAALEDRWVFDHSLKVESDLTVTNDLTVEGLTDLDSTTITGRAGLTLSGLSIENTSENTSLMILPTGKVVGRELAASAFTNPDLQTVTDVDYLTTTPIIAKGFKGDSANLGVQLNVTGKATVQNLVITQLTNKPDLLTVLAYQNDSAETTTLENTAHTPLTYFTIDQAAETGSDQLTRQIDVTQPINLDAGFTAGLNNPGTPAGAFDVIRVADAGGTDSAFRVTLQSGATKPAEDYTWAFVLGNGDSTGGQDVNIGSQLYIKRSSLPIAAPFSSSLVVPVFKPTNTGVEFDSVGVRTLGTAANVATEFFTLQEVTDNSNQTIGGVAFAETTRGLKIGNLIASIGEFTGAYAPAGDGKALFISPNAEGGADSVGYRDVGAFAFKDTTNLQEVTTGEAGGDSTTASIGVHGLTIRNANDFYITDSYGSFPVINTTDAMMYDSASNQVTIRTLAPSAFEIPSLQAVTQEGGDSTNVLSTFAGGMNYDITNTTGVPLVTQTDIEAEVADYYELLLVQTGGAEAGRVKRGQAGVITRLNERDTLRSVTDRAISNGLPADSARVPVEFSNYNFRLSGLEDSNDRDTLVAIDTSTGQLSRRTVTSIQDLTNFDDVTSRGILANRGIGIQELRVQKGGGFGGSTNTSFPNNYETVISVSSGTGNPISVTAQQGQFDSALNVDGLATFNDRVNLRDAFFDIDNLNVTRYRFSAGANFVENVSLTPLTSAAGFTEISGNAANESLVSLTRHSNNEFGAYLVLAKNRGDSAVDLSPIQNGDQLGSIIWNGVDNTSQEIGASLRVVAKDTVSSGNLPTKFQFSTYPSNTESIDLEIDDNSLTTPHSINMGNFLTINNEANGTSSGINVKTDVSNTISHFISFDSADNGSGDSFTKMRFGVKSIADGSVTNQLILDGQNGASITTDYSSTDFKLDNRTNGAATASKLLFTSGNSTSATEEYEYAEIRTVFTERTAGSETARMELRVAGNDFGAAGTRVKIDSAGEVLVTDTEKLKLDTGVKLQDASNRTLVIYDSAGAVLWGNV